jgi:phosphoglycolate phosphatase
MTILFWDIDGTLLTTGKAGVPAWEAAVRETTGREFARTFELLGVSPANGLLDRMVARYEDLLPSALPLKQGRVLPNVREILEALRDRPDVRSYLLTGNTRRGARAKLTHYDLFKYFPDGAFAEDQGSRASIATRALELARQYGRINEEQLFVVGDTPHDIECAAAIDARTIAVATGGYSVDELSAHGPWRVFEQLPPAVQFLELVGLASASQAATEKAGTRG